MKEIEKYLAGHFEKGKPQADAGLYFIKQPGRSPFCAMAFKT